MKDKQTSGMKGNQTVLDPKKNCAICFAEFKQYSDADTFGKRQLCPKCRKLNPSIT